MQRRKRGGSRALRDWAQVAFDSGPQVPTGARLLLPRRPPLFVSSTRAGAKSDRSLSAFLSKSHRRPTAPRLIRRCGREVALRKGGVERARGQVGARARAQVVFADRRRRRPTEPSPKQLLPLREPTCVPPLRIRVVDPSPKTARCTGSDFVAAPRWPGRRAIPSLRAPDAARYLNLTGSPSHVFIYHCECAFCVHLRQIYASRQTLLA